MEASLCNLILAMTTHHFYYTPFFRSKSVCSSPHLRDIVCVLSHFSHVFATLWTVAHQAPLSMRFSRQGYWSGLPCPPPGDLPDPGIKPISLLSPALTGRFFTTALPGKWSGFQHMKLPGIYSAHSTCPDALLSGFELATAVSIRLDFYFCLNNLFIDLLFGQTTQHGGY